MKDDIRCEEVGRVQVRGISHPVATYRVLDLYGAERAARIRSELPHLKLDADPERMTPDERRQAAALLQDALQRLGPTPLVPPAPKTEGTRESPPPSRARRHVRSA